ncbi:MAG: glycosyltransferase family 39 protein [Chloroflexota bacterium]|nr:glycosyltransferase family 39 protein [Chloroflexota bacterium]
MARPKGTAILILIIWLGFALRLHELASVPLRGDEAFSALNWAGIPLHQSLTEIARLEPHPPLTYLLFRFWGLLIGGIDSPFTLRLLPVFGNLIGVAGAYALAFRLSRKRTGGIAAALIWAIHPYEIWHSQDFRNYAVWAGLSVTSLWLGLRLIDRPLKINWLLHALMAATCALMFYTEVFMSIAMALVAICWKKSDHRFLSGFLPLQGIAVLIALLAFLVLQAGLLASGAYPGNLLSLYIPDFLFRFLPVLTLGETAPASSLWLWIFLALSLGLFAGILARGSRRELQFIGAIVVIPFLLLGLLSLRVNIFHPRYVLGTIPGFVLLISLGSARLAAWIAKTAGAWQGYVMPLLLVPWLILSALSLHTYYNDAAFRKSPAWQELGDFLNNRVTSDDLVIQLSADPAFGYYYRGPAEDRALPSGPLQPANSIIDELQAARGNYDSIYVVSNAMPSWRNARVVEDWMRENMQPVMLSDASGLAIRQYQEWIVLEAGLIPLASFGGAVDLLDYRFFDEPLPSGELLLRVYWRPLGITGNSLKSFAHVYGERNPETGEILWAQDDQYPQSGRIDSRSWTPAEVFRDVYYLPAETLQAGSYELRLGWYDPVSGARLLTEAGSDSFLLQGFDYPPKP